MHIRGNFFAYLILNRNQRLSAIKILCILGTKESIALSGGCIWLALYCCHSARHAIAEKPKRKRRCVIKNNIKKQCFTFNVTQHTESRTLNSFNYGLSKIECNKEK